MERSALACSMASGGPIKTMKKFFFVFFGKLMYYVRLG